MAMCLLNDLLNDLSEELLTLIVRPWRDNQTPRLITFKKRYLERLHIDEVVGPVQSRLCTHIAKLMYATEQQDDTRVKLDYLPTPVQKERQIENTPLAYLVELLKFIKSQQ